MLSFESLHGISRAIVKCRRNHEYHKEDFLAAIKYELHLDLLRKHRKKKFKITGSRKDADYGIQNRIHGIFKSVLKKFKGDLKLWLQYIEFAETSRHRISLSRIFGQALAIHPSATNLWVKAAKFQFEELKDPSSARTLFHQALRANADSHHLWLEYFRMELMHTDKVHKRKQVLGLEAGDVEEEGVSDQFLSYQVASVAFQRAIKQIPDDVEFRLAFLPICHLFADTASLQEEIYESLRKDFPHHALMWDALARRGWEGLDIATLKASRLLELENQSELIFSEGLRAASSDRDGVEREEEVGVAKEGVGLDPNLSLLWEYYFKWAVERYQDEECAFKTVKKKAKDRLLTAFTEASSCGLLNANTYQQYVMVLQSLDKDEEALMALEAGLRAHPSSVPLWLVKLSGVDVASGEEGAERTQEMEQLCMQALSRIPAKNSLPIWQVWLTKLMTLPEKEIVENVFKAGVRSDCAEVSEALGVLYLEWAGDVGGLPKARKVYKRLLDSFPIPYTVYDKCLELEEQGMQSECSGEQCAASSGPGKVDMRRLRELYERALRDYGATRVELWLRCIGIELRQEGGDLERVGKLHWRAVKQLQPALTSQFLERYSLLHLTINT